MSNTITAYFKGRVGVCESVYQYDYGLVLVLDGINFHTAFDAYFSIENEEEAIPAIGQDDRVAIPNSCLANPGKVTLHVPEHTGQNDSEVEYIVTFKVIGRAKPVDDGTPADQVAIAAAIAALQTKTAQIPQDIQDYYDNHIEPDIQDNVYDWLDEHPEATTTVLDGSLNDVKFTETERKKKMAFYNTLAEMTSDTSLIVGKWVHVFGECYPEYDGKDLDFVITNVSNYYAIPLENGLYAEPYVPYAHPETYSPDVAYNILKCGLTYFDRSNLIYTPEGHSYESIFADEVAVYQDDTMSIDCSTFAQACLMGINYQNSKFVLSNNVPEPWGYKFPRGIPVSQIQSKRTHGFTASELAFYAYLHGWLYEISPDGGNVAVGDFVFDSYEITRENEFREIGHVQIVFDKISQFDEGIKCIEVGSGATGVNKYGNNICHIRAYRSGIDTAIKYGARFPIQASASSKNITSIRRRDLEYPYTLTGSPIGVTGTVYTTENIKVGEVYTAVVKGDLSALVDGWYPFVRLVSVTGSIIYNTLSYAASIDGATNTMYMTFTPLRDTNTASIYNAIQIGINNTSGSGSLSVTIDDIQIYKGLFFGENEKTNVNVTFNSGITVNTKAIYGTKARFDLTVPISGSTYTSISLGTVDLYNFEQRMVSVNVVSANTSNGAVTSHTGISANLLYAQNNLTLNVFADVENLSSVRIRFDIDFGS